MALLISVAPAGDGWAVSSEALENDLTFDRGARAEAAARALAERYANAGRPAEVEVYNADHGWCTLDAPSYDKGEAERAYARQLALFAKL